LEANLAALREYRKQDPGFEQALDAFVEDEATIEDPLEGEPIIGDFIDGQFKPVGPVQSKIRELIGGRLGRRRPSVATSRRPGAGYGAASINAMRGDWKPTAVVFRRLLNDFLGEPTLPDTTNVYTRTDERHQQGLSCGDNLASIADPKPPPGRDARR